MEVADAKSENLKAIFNFTKTFGLMVDWVDAFL